MLVGRDMSIDRKALNRAANVEVKRYLYKPWAGELTAGAGATLSVVTATCAPRLEASNSDSLSGGTSAPPREVIQRGDKGWMLRDEAFSMSYANLDSAREVMRKQQHPRRWCIGEQHDEALGVEGEYIIW